MPAAVSRQSCKFLQMASELLHEALDAQRAEVAAELHRRLMPLRIWGSSGTVYSLIRNQGMSVLSKRTHESLLPVEQRYPVRASGG